MEYYGKIKIIDIKIRGQIDMSFKSILMIFISFMLSINTIGNSSENSLSQYNSLSKEFYRTYFEVVEDIDLSSTIKSLEAMCNDKNSMKIERMSKLIEIIKSDVPEGKEILFESMNERYRNLVFLADSYPKLKELDIDSKIEIDSILISIGLDKGNWEDPDSTIIWY